MHKKRNHFKKKRPVRDTSGWYWRQHRQTECIFPATFTQQPADIQVHLDHVCSHWAHKHKRKPNISLKTDQRLEDTAVGLSAEISEGYPSVCPICDAFRDNFQSDVWTIKTAEQLKVVFSNHVKKNNGFYCRFPTSGSERNAVQACRIFKLQQTANVPHHKRRNMVIHLLTDLPSNVEESTTNNVRQMS